MTNRAAADLREIAARSGLVPTYVDASGREVVVGHATLRALMDALASSGEAGKTTILLRSKLAEAGEPRVLTLPEEIRLPAQWAIRAEGLSVAGVTEGLRIELPPDLGYGVYRLEISGAQAGPRDESTLVLAPELAYQGSAETQRVWLLAVQLYGVRSHRNWGHGDFSDLAMLLDLAARIGAAGIGLNPLHALLNDGGENVSPYSPSSRLFINYLYVDVEAIPEFSAITADDLRARIEALRSARMIDYAGVAAIKEQALRRCFACFEADGADDADFALFRAERGDMLRLFASFEAARRHGRRPSLNRTNAVEEVDESEIRYHEYVQWRADRQLRACRDKAADLGLPIGLYMDLAVGVRPDGADAWCEQESYFRDVSIGAPPDLLNVNGQDWGLTTHQPQALERGAFESFRRVLAANMRYAGALRIDHILWLNRVYLVPRGLQPREGCYLQYPLDALLGVLTIESRRHRCIVIGEDLGTVPAELRTALRRWGVWTYHVMQFERDKSGAFRPARDYQARALATFSTHDLPPFAAWITGSDLDTKHRIGIDPGETEEERRRAHASLTNVLSSGKSERSAPEFLQVAEFLAAAPSRLVVVGLEDALGQRELTNVPGTTTQHPNWRLRSPVSVEELASDERILRLTAVFAGSDRDVRRQK